MSMPMVRRKRSSFRPTSIPQTLVDEVHNGSGAEGRLGVVSGYSDEACRRVGLTSECREQAPNHRERQGHGAKTIDRLSHSKIPQESEQDQ